MNANAPPKLGVHLADRVRSARRRYRKRLARCQEKFSVRAVHQLRIETRRVLALLDLLEALHFPESLKKTRKEFKRRLDAFDDLRDTQVQRALLEPRWRRFPEARDFEKLLDDREEKLVKKLARKIKATTDAGLNRRFKRFEACLGDGPIGGSHDAAAALAVLNAAYHRVATLRRHVRRGDAATLHRLRVAFKRFRYMSELLEPFLPRRTAESLERMKQYQVLAGDIQDHEVLLETIARCVDAGELRPAAMRNLRNDLLRRQQRAIDSFMKQIDALFDFQPRPSAREALFTK